MEVKNDILWRVYLGFLGLMLLGVLILGKAFYTQNIEGSYWKSMGDSMHTRILDLAAERGIHEIAFIGNTVDRFQNGARRRDVFAPVISRTDGR